MGDVPVSNKDAHKVLHDELIKELEAHEFNASECGDRRVVKMTAEELAQIFESGVEAVARDTWNAAMEFAAERFEREHTDEWAAAELRGLQIAETAPEAKS